MILLKCRIVDTLYYSFVFVGNYSKAKYSLGSLPRFNCFGYNMLDFSKSIILELTSWEADFSGLLVLVRLRCNTLNVR